MNKSPRPSCVNNKPGAEFHIFAVLSSFKPHDIAAFRHLMQLDLIHILNPEFHGLLNQQVIEIRAIPMCVRYLVARAGGD